MNHKRTKPAPSEQIPTTSIESLDYYLVGGAVRDKLLNISPKDNDYVVVGATEQQMLSLGFQPVGKDFPVFLHPQTHEEYALARTERKQGHGYTGFSCYAAPDVTLTQDLARRDLTINAMAIDKAGQLIDPYNGLQDLQQRVLRHVSPAFIEDPLRVLRVARFAARYHQQGFTIAPETLALMTHIAQSGELAYLPGERIWQELHASLQLSNAQIFFQVLRDCQALAVIWPELDVLWGVPNPAKWHPEICSGIHTMMVLQRAIALSDDDEIRFAALCHDLGKGLTPAAAYPSHRGHEKSGIALVEKSCQRFKTPKRFIKLAKLACEYHLHCHKAFDLKTSTLLKLFNALDIWRNNTLLEQFLTVCQADFQGRLGFEQRPYPQKDYLAYLAQALRQLDVKQVIKPNMTGSQIKQDIEHLRLNILKQHQAKWLAEHQPSHE